jgi:subtilase family serine protease
VLNQYLKASFVQKYLSTPGVFVPPSQFFNASKRAYPDISAVGARILVVTGGGFHYSEGTSASTPTVAAMISLLNDARFQAGKSTLGFLNPMLYKMYADNARTFTGKTR